MMMIRGLRPLATPAACIVGIERGVPIWIVLLSLVSYWATGCARRPDLWIGWQAAFGKPLTASQIRVLGLRSHLGPPGHDVQLAKKPTGQERPQRQAQGARARQTP